MHTRGVPAILSAKAGALDTKSTIIKPHRLGDGYPRFARQQTRPGRVAEVLGSQGSILSVSQYRPFLLPLALESPGRHLGALVHPWALQKIVWQSLLADWRRPGQLCRLQLGFALPAWILIRLGFPTRGGPLRGAILGR